MSQQQIIKMFGEIIKNFRVRNGLSQTAFVDLVQRSNSTFSNLDVVTLSRWERGVTKPHLTRQNELLDLVGIDVFDVWKSEFSSNVDINFLNKLSRNGYTDSNDTLITETIIINSSNIVELQNYVNLIDLVCDFEKSILFERELSKYSSKISMFQNLIEEFSGELILIVSHGQLVGHILTLSQSVLEEYMSDLIKIEEGVHLVLSFNCTSELSIIDTLAREAYKYLQSPNPNKGLHIFINNKRMFDFLFHLGFEYKTVKCGDIKAKYMMTDAKQIKSQRTWMQLIVSYKGGEDE
ncbi:helix-turn-helix domain-containing protein [Vibrio sp. BS-M-Sm-2]|uniref:helix-turn-helix domain-containing protein n=1 Tax=Vibrio sp. BS-M-Sm-2 TaxID=3241167 RepID=UPI003557132D